MTNWRRMGHVEIRHELPNHPVPEEAERLARNPSLRVEGLVARPVTLRRNTLVQLRRHTLEATFACEEGWSVPALRWAGIRMSDVLALAGPLPEARFVRVGAGDYVLPLSLADAKTAVLCDELNDGPLTTEHGAPWRLLMPGGACYASVKWVDRLELVDERGDNTAQAIARGRLS